MSTTTEQVNTGINGAKSVRGLKEVAAAAHAARAAEVAGNGAERDAAREAGALLLTERLLTTLGGSEMGSLMEGSAGKGHPSCFLEGQGEMLMPTKEGGAPFQRELSHLSLTGPGGQRMELPYVELLTGPLPGRDGKARVMAGGTVLQRVNKVLAAEAKERGDVPLRVELQYRGSEHRYRVTRQVGEERDDEGRVRGVYEFVLDRDGRPLTRRATRLQLVVVWDQEKYDHQQAEHERKQAEREHERKHGRGHQQGGRGHQQQGQSSGQGSSKGKVQGKPAGREMTLAEYQTQRGVAPARAEAPVRQQRRPEEIEAGYGGRQGGRR